MLPNLRRLDVVFLSHDYSAPTTIAYVNTVYDKMTAATLKPKRNLFMTQSPFSS